MTSEQVLEQWLNSVNCALLLQRTIIQNYYLLKIIYWSYTVRFIFHFSLNWSFIFLKISLLVVGEKLQLSFGDFWFIKYGRVMTLTVIADILVPNSSIQMEVTFHLMTLLGHGIERERAFFLCVSKKMIYVLSTLRPLMFYEEPIPLDRIKLF